MKKNKFSKALKHLKSKKIDEKIKSLEEAAPTNNMSGVYQVTPSTGDAFRMGVGDPDKKFYPKQDGTWPSGIPANASDTVYIRKGGYFDSGKGTVPTNQVPVSRDFSYDDVTANGTANTDTLIRPSDGKPYTSLPPNTESFILGPLVGNYAINHGYDDFTNIGYIQKDTRQFVLLATIQGFFNGEDRNSGNARTWDGTGNQATIYNSNFKLEHLLWMQERYNKGDFADNFPFNFSGGVPVERHPSNNAMGMGVIMGVLNALFGGANDNIGTPQDPADVNDINSLDLQGLINKALTVADIALLGMSVLGILFPEPTTSAAGVAGVASVLSKLKKLKALKAAAKAGKFKFPKFPKPKFPKPFKPKGKGLGGGADVGATGLKKPGFDALNPNQIGPKGLHKGSKGLLSPKGGGTYSAPKVGKVGPNPLRPGTGGSRYTQFGSNPLNPQGGQGGGVIGSVIPKGARGIGGIEPQKVVNPKTFQKGSDMFNRIMKGAYPKSKAAERIRQKGIRAGFKPGSGSIEFKNLPNLNMDFDLDFGMYLVEEVLSDDEQNRRLEAMTQDPKFFENIDGIIKTLEDELELSKLFVMLFGDDEEDVQESVITESKVRILREIRQPLKEIKELPKTQKLKGYRPNFKGKFSPQNTPDVTASKKSDDIVSGKNASRQIWTAKDKYWKGYETTERMNIIYDNLGHGSQYFDRIVGENVRLKNKQTKDVQEHLNMLAHQKAMREVYGIKEYENNIDESETYDNKVKDPLFAKVSNRLKKEIDYSDKPSPHGYPTEPPAKIDPNTGMHPKYGKRYKYDKLDPQSAEGMPMQDDPEIDANIQKATDQKAKARKLMNLLGKK